MRLLSFLSLCCLVGASGAHGAVTGAYFGPSLGFGTVHSHHTSTTNLTGVKITEKKLKHTSFLGGMVAGFGFRSNCLFAAFELEGLFDNYDHTYIVNKTFGRETFNLKHTFQYGAAIRFGYSTPNDILFYLRMGLAGGKWSEKYKAKDDFGFHTSTTHNVHKVTFAPGVGVQAMVGKRFSVRGELRYTPSFNKKFKIKPVSTAVLQFEDSTMRSKISQLSCMFTVLFHI